MHLSDAHSAFLDEVQEKRLAIGPRTARGKVNPRHIVSPSDYDSHWWKVAPDILRVNIKTGEVITFRWPFKEEDRQGPKPKGREVGREEPLRGTRHFG